MTFRHPLSAIIIYNCSQISCATMGQPEIKHSLNVCKMFIHLFLSMYIHWAVGMLNKNVHENRYKRLGPAGHPNCNTKSRVKHHLETTAIQTMQSETVPCQSQLLRVLASSPSLSRETSLVHYASTISVRSIT